MGKTPMPRVLKVAAALSALAYAGAAAALLWHR
jgi:hypothetical protein